jgi:hypothetical protein
LARKLLAGTSRGIVKGKAKSKNFFTVHAITLCLPCCA